MEREAQLLEWRLTLTEERNAVMVPSAGSGIPGAPAEWYDTAASILSNLHLNFRVKLSVIDSWYSMLSVRGGLNVKSA